MARDKLRRALALTDPPPNWRYEVGCYLQSFAAFSLIGFGFINLILCLSSRTLVTSSAFFALGFLLLSRLKLIRELIKLMKEGKE